MHIELMKKTFVIFLILFNFCMNQVWAYNINLATYTETQNRSIIIEGLLDNDYLKISNAFIKVKKDKSFKIELPLQNGLNQIPITIRSLDNKLLKQNYYVQRNAFFEDMPKGHWSKEIIEQLVNHDIIPSYSDRYFEPTSEITHGELLYWIVRLKGYEVPSKYSNVSIYLTKDNWLTPYMIAAKRNKLIKGNLRRFNPYLTISRNKAILLVLNNFKMVKGKPIHQTESLKKFLRSSKMDQRIKAAIKEGILFGPSTQWISVDLKRPIYRDEVAKVIYYTQEVQELMAKRKKGKSLSIKKIMINTAPLIDGIKLYPQAVMYTSKNVSTKMIFARVTVADPDGLEDIESVEVDVSRVDTQRNMVNLLDNGTWGDKVAGDGEFSLEFNIPNDVSPGIKRLPIYVTDKSGFQARSYLPFEIVKGE